MSPITNPTRLYGERGLQTILRARLGEIQFGYNPDWSTTTGFNRCPLVSQARSLVNKLVEHNEPAVPELALQVSS